MRRSGAATHGAVSDCMTYRLVTTRLESAEASTFPKDDSGQPPETVAGDSCLSVNDRGPA
jgi:hypothetical protein